ncbi:MAG: response regulator [Gammaproteobacteria bacterium]|nr:response regulator [Gammaproteobacteria bacterium]MDH5801682.1 response regulator [Gammaproteobacteria bacterium]
MEKVLIIEDNDNNMELITFILEASGYETLRALTGKEGIELARTAGPDLVILDIQLPDIDGAEVLKSIRQFRDGKSLPVIAMTSYAMAGDRESLLQIGCSGYIEKPIDPDRVVGQIHKILRELKCEYS